MTSASPAGAAQSDVCDAPKTLSISPRPGPQQAQDDQMRRLALEVLSCTAPGRELLTVLETSGYALNFTDQRELDVRYGEGTTAHIDHLSKKIEVSRLIGTRPFQAAISVAHELIHARDASESIAKFEAYQKAYQRTRQKGVERVISFLNPFNNPKKPELPEKRALREAVIEDEIRAFTEERAIARLLKLQCREFEGIEPEDYGFCAPLTRDQWIEVLKRDPVYKKYFDPKAKLPNTQVSAIEVVVGLAAEERSTLPTAPTLPVPAIDTGPTIPVEGASTASADVFVDVAAQGHSAVVELDAVRSGNEDRRAADDAADEAREAQQGLDRAAEDETQRQQQALEQQSRDDLLAAQQAEFDAAVAAGIQQQQERDNPPQPEPPPPPVPAATEPAPPLVREPDEPEVEGDDTYEDVTPPWTPPVADAGGDTGGGDPDGGNPAADEPLPPPPPVEPPPPDQPPPDPRYALGYTESDIYREDHEAEFTPPAPQPDPGSEVV